eukprot:SAG31_NODE_487_length_14980_cov_9.526376_12_plen_150_part_00
MRHALAHKLEVITTSKKWKCTASDSTNAATIPSSWKSATFDDSSWEVATSYGRNSDVDNYWQTHMGRAVDGVASDAHWIWTSDGTGHNDIFCRTVSAHVPQDCAVAARRYFSDYPEARSDNQNAWDSFQTRGKWEGKIWHSELYVVSLC